MLPPKKPAHSVTVAKHRTIYFPNPINFYKHLDWEGTAWEEFAQITATSHHLYEPTKSNLGELAVDAALTIGMAFELNAAPTTRIN